MTIIIFLLVLTILVLFHECGHFFAARIFGVEVEEFGFGFPPRAWGKKRGKTLYSVNWIPLGGFVKLKGETGEVTDDPGSFASKALWQKAIILVAGVFMNLILAFLLFYVGFVSGFPTLTENVPTGAIISNRVLVIEGVIPGSPAATSGIEGGERIISVNGVEVKDYASFKALVPQSKESEIVLVVGNGKQSKYKITTTRLPGEEVHFGIGVQLAETGNVRFGLLRAVPEALKMVWNVTAGTTVAFYDLFKNLITGKGVSNDISGPVGIAVLTGKVARLGFAHLVQFAALLSVNLAILNILPFPALDGGRLLFIVIAKLRGRAVAAKVETAIHALGFFLLMALVVLVTVRDIRNLF